MPKHIVILGGGISGLATAYFLKNKAKVTLIEKCDRVGGWIETLDKGDFFFEKGPRGFRPRGKGEKTLTLIKEVGLEKELIFSDATAKRRYLWLDNALKAFSPILLIRYGLLPALWKEWQTPPSQEQDESIEQFFSRRFNSTLTQQIAIPVVQGIFGGEARLLSLRSCFPALHELETTYGSILKGMFKTRKKKATSALPPLCSFKKGMESLPKALFEKSGAEFHLSTEILQIKGNRIETGKGSLKADHIVIALPAHTLPKLFPESASILNPLPFLTLSLVFLGYSATILKKKGFGYLVGLKEKEGVLGMTWDSDIFPDQKSSLQTRLCLMVRGEFEKEALYSLALKTVEDHLKVKERPLFIEHTIAKEAIPQYPVGYHNRLSHLHFPQISFVGSSFGCVGVNDCIAQAESIAFASL